jgi:hypothetical protein
MNALQQPLEPPKSPRPSPRRRPQRRHYSSQSLMAIESTTKLFVNVILSTAAITALTRLVPYNFSQQTKLREIRIEVKQTEERVTKLRDNFEKTFDPSATRHQMLDNTYLSDPNQRRVVWTDPQKPQ